MSYLEAWTMTNDPVGVGQFRCDRCKGVFDKGQTEAETRQEAISTFGKSFDFEDAAMVCDDCYQLMLPANHPHLVEEVVAEQLRDKLPRGHNG